MNTLDQTIEAFGGSSAWKASLPARHWIRSDNGWCSHARKRCTDDCDAGITPADGGDPDEDVSA